MFFVFFLVHVLARQAIEGILANEVCLLVEDSSIAAWEICLPIYLAPTNRSNHRNGMEHVGTLNNKTTEKKEKIDATTSYDHCLKMRVTVLCFCFFIYIIFPEGLHYRCAKPGATNPHAPWTADQRFVVLIVAVWICVVCMGVCVFVCVRECVFVCMSVYAEVLICACYNMLLSQVKGLLIFIKPSFPSCPTSS